MASSVSCAASGLTGRQLDALVEQLREQRASHRCGRNGDDQRANKMVLPMSAL